MTYRPMADTWAGKILLGEVSLLGHTQPARLSYSVGFPPGSHLIKWEGNLQDTQRGGLE